jgi:hypothetical protein
MSTLLNEPSEKKKRKQKMTAAQLATLEAKQPRRVSYDSDDEPIRCGTPMHIKHARAAAFEASAPSAPSANAALPMPTGAPTMTVHFSGAQYSPVRNQEAWENELGELLRAQREGQPIVQATIPRVQRPRNHDFLGDGDSLDDETDGDDDLYGDPGHLVLHPFCPKVRLTAAERDDCLEEEQHSRTQEGIPLLVPNPLLRDNWIDPPAMQAHGVVVELPSFQATPVADISFSPED